MVVWRPGTNRESKIVIKPNLTESVLKIAAWGAFLALCAALTQIIRNPALGFTAIFGIIFGLASFGGARLQSEFASAESDDEPKS